MKLEYSFLGLAALASAAIIEPRQDPMTKDLPQGLATYLQLLQKVAPNMKPAMVLDSEGTKLRSNSIRKKIRYGPFTLPASKVTFPLQLYLLNDLMG
jgi:hypothetical protein